MNRGTVSLRRAVLSLSLLVTFGLGACEAGGLDSELDGLDIAPDGATVGDGITGVGDITGSDVITGDATDPDAALAVCGDGLMDDGEACDDGNLDAGDGCSGECAVEPGWACDGAGACECAEGYTGANCDVCADGYHPMEDAGCMSAEDCSLETCSGNGVCVFGDEGPPGCECAPGWMGKSCDEDRDECAESEESLCVNGGSCVNGEPESLAPECLAPQLDELGAEVPGCSSSDTCTEAVCAADTYCCDYAWDEICASIAHGTGACNNPGWLCECPEGWVGPKCDMDRDECHPSVDPCQNDGICENEPGSFFCSCPWGWTGELCDENEDECSVVDDLCKNGAACVDMTPEEVAPACLVAQVDDAGEPIPGCASVPECEAVVCSNNHGCCNDGWDEECAAQAAEFLECKVPGYVCECADGWTGEHCEEDIDECADDPCTNAFGCENTAGSYICSCEPGWEGPNCALNVNECELDEVPCANDSTCLDVEAALVAPECLKAQLDAEGIPSPGCEASETCEASVCSYDPYCCENGWDDICAQEATFDPECNQPGFQCECADGWTGPLCDWDIDECLGDHGCSENGWCVNGPGGYSCECEPGWSGWDCSENDNECAWEESPCKNEGVCTDLDPTPPAPACLVAQQDEEGKWTKGCAEVPECEEAVCAYDSYCCEFAWDELCAEYALVQPACAAAKFDCVCDAAWTGPTCEEDVDECLAGAECANGGACVNEPGGWSCDCPAGWEGPLCEENVDECAWEISPCGEASNCIDLSPDENPMGYACECGPGWAGTNCDEVTNTCVALMPCQNGGECVGEGVEYECVCSEAWTGANCELDANECETGAEGCSTNAVCTNTIGSYTCECNDGFTGDGFVCVDNDECADPADNDCHEEATCTNTIGAYTCACNSGWDGDGFECVNVDECADESSPCGPNTECVDTEGSFECPCVEGYENNVGGFGCVDIDECADEIDDCGENSQCINVASTFECECLWGYASENGKNCVNVDECGDGIDACEEGSTCVDSVPYPCSNAEGCEDEICREAVGALDAWCLNDWDETCGTCAAGGLGFNGVDCVDAAEACQGKGYMCTCEAGWDLSESGLGCDDIDECAESPCVNKGQCWNGPGDYGCDCGPGWGGMHCEENVDECAEGVCQNGAQCDDLTPFVSGALCSSTTECDVQECRDAVAEFDIWCGLGWDSFCAQCAGGGLAFGGINCSNVGPACTDFQAGFDCTCTPGWEGPVCGADINECAFEVPICEHGGACENLPGDYSCDCPPGWEGKNCELDIDECLAAPCVNGACENTPGDYTCECEAGWEGKNCELDIDECALGMCQNQALCENVPGSYNCTCQDGTTGLNCEQAVEQCSAGVCGMNAVDCMDYEPVLLQAGCPSADGCDDPVCRDAVCAVDSWCCDDWDGLCASCANEGAGLAGADCSQAVEMCTIKYGGDFQCTCDQGWKGDVCDEDVDECLDFPCQNAGECVNEPGSFICVCQPGWEGAFCSDSVNECDAPDACAFGQVCEELVPATLTGCPGSDDCVDTLCRDAVCALDDYCCTSWDSSCASCATHGVGYGGMDCSEAVGSCGVTYGPGYECACPKGWAGANCDQDINECLDNPCVNGACTNEPGSFSCECDAGWEGEQCELNIDECLDPGTCNNGACKDLEAQAGYQHCTSAVGCDVATCRDAVGSLDNYCNTGWDNSCAACAQGQVTQYADCTGIGAECFADAKPGFACDCMAGWTGAECEQNVNECELGAVCLNDGVCVDVEPESGGWLACQKAQFDDTGAPVAGCSASNACTDSVCAEDPYCCDTAWDNICADLAVTMDGCVPAGYACDCAPGWEGADCANLSPIVDMNSGGACATYSQDFESGPQGWEAVPALGPVFTPFVDPATGDTSFFADQVDGVDSKTWITREFLLPPAPAATLSFHLLQNVEEDCPYDVTRVFVNSIEAQAICTDYFDDQVGVDLAPYAGMPVEVRIEFATGDAIGNSGDGVYVDDIKVTTCP